LDRNTQIQASRDQQEESNKKYERAVAKELAARQELQRLESEKSQIEQEYIDSLAKTSDLANKIAVCHQIDEYDRFRKCSYQERKDRSALANTRKKLLETNLKIKKATKSCRFAQEMLKIAKDEVAMSREKAMALKLEINAEKAEKIRQLAIYAKVPDDKLDSAYVKLELDGNFGVYFNNTNEDGQEVACCHVVTPIGLIFKRDTQTQELSMI